MFFKIIVLIEDLPIICVSVYLSNVCTNAIARDLHVGVVLTHDHTQTDKMNLVKAKEWAQYGCSIWLLLFAISGLVIVLSMKVRR